MWITLSIVTTKLQFQAQFVWYSIKKYKSGHTSKFIISLNFWGWCDKENFEQISFERFTLHCPSIILDKQMPNMFFVNWRLRRAFLIPCIIDKRYWRFFQYKENYTCRRFDLNSILLKHCVIELQQPERTVASIFTASLLVFIRRFNN